MSEYVNLISAKEYKGGYHCKVQALKTGTYHTFVIGATKFPSMNELEEEVKKLEPDNFRYQATRKLMDRVASWQDSQNLPSQKTPSLPPHNKSRYKPSHSRPIVSKNDYDYLSKPSSSCKRVMVHEWVDDA